MAVAPVVKFYPADRKALDDLLAECRPSGIEALKAKK